MPLVPIAPMRNLAARDMDDRCSIVGREWVSDNEGSGTYEDVTRAEDLPCVLRSPTARERELYGQYVETAEAVVGMPYGTEVGDDDDIIITSRGNERWTVTGVPPQSATISASTKAFVRRDEA